MYWGHVHPDDNQNEGSFAFAPTVQSICGMQLPSFTIMGHFYDKRRCQRCQFTTQTLLHCSSSSGGNCDDFPTSVVFHHSSKLHSFGMREEDPVGGGCFWVQEWKGAGSRVEGPESRQHNTPYGLSITEAPFGLKIRNLE